MKEYHETTAVEYLALEVPACDDVFVDLHKTVAEQLPPEMGTAGQAMHVA